MLSFLLGVYFISVGSYGKLSESIKRWFLQAASKMVLVVKNLPANVRDIRYVGSIPGSGRSSGGGHGNSLQYSCLENPMDRRDWWALVCGSQSLPHR